MTLGASRWHVVSESRYSWEREAQEWLRTCLPNYDPWHVWTNFEFIDDEGRVNEVDALILAPGGLFLVEIKSRPGEVRGDAHTWNWRSDGRERTLDNPLLLTDRKAKRLGSLLRRQPAAVKSRDRLPFVEPLVFLSDPGLRCLLEGRARSGVSTRGRPGHPEDDGIVAVLTRGLRFEAGRGIAGSTPKTLQKALSEAGIRASNKHRSVGPYRLDKLLSEGEGYQDWLGQHETVTTVQRRVRVYTRALAESTEAKQTRTRSARREFEVLEGIEHAGILRCRDFQETELGPALIFDHDPEAIRLDHLMRERGASLTLTQRLSLVRDLAHTLKFAHGKRLYHRALTPQSVLVRGAATAEPGVRLMNWQTGSRGGTDPQALHRTTGTHHVERYVEDPGRVYLAPETDHAEASQSAALDVFSLGALSYLILSGKAPASSPIELRQILREQQGLNLADALDHCPPKLAELIRDATHPEVLGRHDSVDGFLAGLDDAEDELTAPDPEATVDPSIARPGDRLEGGLTVIRPLGKGSSAVVLLVRADGRDEELVLKVAHDAAHNAALRGEGQTLERLRHANIIDYRETREIGGRTALLLRNAGDTTLAQRLKQGRLSLDLLERFGEELLEAVRELEIQGLCHRDIKPENIGVQSSPSGRLRLVLFDFSLSRMPAENLRAGTPPYLDPFLGQRSHRRWDLYAERYAAAVTLYEMAVGRPPRYGDGNSAPEVVTHEASIDRTAFEPNLRDGLSTFFAKALRRAFTERHDNAEEMLAAWRAVFAGAKQRPVTTPTTDPVEALAARLQGTDSVAELGYGDAAMDVLSRMGIQTVRELLGVDRLKFRYLQGVGDRVRREIRLTAKRLAQLRPDLVPGRSSLLEHDDEAAGSSRDPVAINELHELLLPEADDRPESASDVALEYYLGLDLPAARSGDWPSAGDAAGAAQISREAFARALTSARSRWQQQKPLTELRAQIRTLLDSHGAVMTHRELADAILALRGSALGEEVARTRQACAVLRAAVEAEAAEAAPRYLAHDHHPAQLIATDPAWANYAARLGAQADGCALAEPLLSPQRVLEALQGVRLPEVSPGEDPLPLTPARLLRLATQAAREAALSSRQEIYRRGMPALQALKQSLNALLGLPLLKPEELVSRVHGRYPEAERLPPQRQLLNQLLEAAGAPLSWDAEQNAWTTRTIGSGLTQSGSRSHRPSNTGDAPTEPAEAEAFAERLDHRLHEGGLLVLGIEARRARAAEARLLERYGGHGPDRLQRLDLDAWWLAALKAEVQRLRADWQVVLRADNAAPGSADAGRLMQLAQRCVPALLDALRGAERPLLVVHPGLLARFGLLHHVGTLETEVGRPGRTPALWLLLPTAEPAVAALDGQRLPLIRPATYAPIPRAWLDRSQLHAA